MKKKYILIAILLIFSVLLNLLLYFSMSMYKLELTMKNISLGQLLANKNFVEGKKELMSNQNTVHVKQNYYFYNGSEFNAIFIKAYNDELISLIENENGNN